MSDFQADLSADPAMMLELLATLTRRAGGEIRFGPEDEIGPFDLKATVLEDEAGAKYLRLNLREITAGHA